jgi:hypothetical protein
MGFCQYQFPDEEVTRNELQVIWEKGEGKGKM